jgi:pimeloyl-ACP methyl ester carboxylesterase
MGEVDTGVRHAGPYRNINLGDMTLPLWVLEFGSDGTCLSPKTRELLVAEAAKPGYTDVFVFSHGWNNTFDKAVASYDKFITGYHQFQRANGLSPPDPYRPLLIGLRWPSIDLVLPGEKAPDIAAGPPAGRETDFGLTDAVRDVTAELEPEDAARFRELAARSDLTGSQARELAGLLAHAYPADDELDDGAAPTGEDVMATWSSLIAAGFAENGGDMSGPDSFGVADEDRASAAGPGMAGVISSVARFDPRDVLRAFTVYQMKDRAGVVGSAGGSALVCDLLRASDQSRVHLIGHSYGCRLLLSAICANSLPRKVQSLLLLEPAVNYLCFARQVPKAGRPGGYRPALSRVEEPVMSTFSPNDKALHDFFHLAVRRRRDLGELKIAALGVVPSIYAALGGWGPGGLDGDEAKELTLMRYPDRYPRGDATCRVLALNGASGIGGHSDVINEWTFWALYNQLAG